MVKNPLTPSGQTPPVH